MPRNRSFTKSVHHHSTRADKGSTKGQTMAQTSQRKATDTESYDTHVTEEELLLLLDDPEADKAFYEAAWTDGTGRSLTLMDGLSPTERIELASKRECFFSEEDIRIAAKEAIRGHVKKWDIHEFLQHFDERCHEMYLDLRNGTWWDKCSYRELDKTNTNGKRRHIDSPNLYLRILEHLWLLYAVPLYDEENIKVGVARNCLPDHGITAKVKEYSVVKEMKNLFYDKRYFKYLLVMDQRKCYPHITPKQYRKAFKQLTRNKFLIDFGEKVSFVGRKLPIGTPTSPYIHNIVMLPYDRWMKENTDWCLRYADDNAMAFTDKADAQRMKWRVQNYWWYEQHIRAKSKTIRIMEIDKETIDFCGFIFIRHADKRISDHDKGITFVRKETLRRALRNDNPEAWGSYFGILQHADAYNIIRKIEEKHMDFAELSQNIRIDKDMDAPTIQVQHLAEQNIVFSILTYKLEFDAETKVPTWCKCLIAYNTTKTIINPQTQQGTDVPVVYLYEFHGSYKYLSEYLYKASLKYRPEVLLPITNVMIEDSNGYIFKNSTNRVSEIYSADDVARYFEYYKQYQMKTNAEMFVDPKKVTPEALQAYNLLTGQNLTMREETKTQEILPNVSRASYKGSYRRK